MREPPALSRAIDALELFLPANEPRSAAEIASSVSAPRSTTYELIRTLVARGYLREDPPSRYSLGLKTFELGSAYQRSLDLAREGHAVAAEIAATCGETVHVAVLDGSTVVYVAKTDSTNPVRMVSMIGGRLPAHCTAVGKAILSGLSDTEIRARYFGEERLPVMTARSIDSLERLLLEVQRARAAGTAYDDFESNPDVRCVAAPVYGQGGAVVAGISVSAPASRLDAGRQRELAALVQQGAAALSRRLGHIETRVGEGELGANSRDVS